MRGRILQIDLLLHSPSNKSSIFHSKRIFSTITASLNESKAGRSPSSYFFNKKNGKFLSNGTRKHQFSSSNNKDQDTQRASSLSKILDPYYRLARLDKPIGTMLLLYPCLWSMTLAAPSGSLPDLKLAMLFTTGAFIMRSAGCTINDLWDRKYDSKVERTKTRPLATGEVSVPQAIAFLGAQLTAGLGILVQLNMPCILMGFGVMPLVVAYPLMKRYTNWPQLVLGLTFNWGALMGYTAVTGSVGLEELAVTGPLYLGSVCWTLVYDTLYAHQDKEDDKKLGLRSTALHFGKNTKPILSTFALMMIASMTVSGYAADLSWPFYTGMVASSSHLAWQIHTAELNNSTNLWERFQSNHMLGAVVASSFLAGKVFI